MTTQRPRRAPNFVALALACTLVGGVARAQLLLAPEQSIDAPSFAAAELDQQAPAVTYGGNGMYFSVWRDGDKNVGQVWAIRGVRFMADGTVLDDPPLTIRNAGEDLVRPAVGFDGTNFLVVWERAAPEGDPDSSDLFGAYVSPTTGAIGAPFTVAGGPAPQTQAVVTGGDGFALVTYNEFATFATQGVQTVWGVLYGQNQTLKPNFQICGNGQNALASSSAWSTSAQTFLVAWRDVDSGGNVWAAQVDGTGAVATPFQVSQTSDDTADISVGVLGDQFVVGWAETDTNPQSIYARAVPASGAPSASVPQFVVSNAPGTDGAYRPQILGVDGQFVGLWEGLRPSGQYADYADIYGGRFQADSTRTDGDGAIEVVADPLFTPVLPSINESYCSAVASAGATGVAVLWRQGNSSSADDVTFWTVDPSTTGWTSHAPGILSRETNLERSWSLAANGQGFLLVWEDSREENNPDGSLDIYGLRIGLDGTPLDTAPFLISSDETTPTLGAHGDQFAAYASGIPGGDFLVVWNDSRGFDDPISVTGLDLYAARVGMTGAPVQVPQHITVAQDAQLQPAIAASSAGWLVAWEDWSPSIAVGEHRSAVFSAFVPAVDDGVTIFEPHQLSLASALQQTACAPVVTWNGSHFFVAYEQPCPEDYAQGPADVIGRWHDTDGTPLGVDVPIATTSYSEISPALAAYDGRVFAVWDEQGTQDGILAATFADLASSAEGPSTALYRAIGNRQSPAATAAGGALLVTWVEDEAPAQISGMRRLATAGLDALDAQPVTLHAGSVYEGPGVLLEPAKDDEGTGLSLMPRFTPKPSVAANATGETLLVADALVPILGSTVVRAQFRKLGLAGNGTACTNDGACAAGICTNGACCDVVCDGVCQSCTTNGCVTTPSTDSRCPTDSATSCATLSTTCRTYADVAAAGSCVAFGECASPSTPGVCTKHTDAADGTLCSAPGCTAAASCMGGACVCSTESNMLEPARSVGCSVVPGRRSNAGQLVWLLLCVALIIARRRATTS